VQFNKLLTGAHGHLVPKGVLANGLVWSCCHMHLPSQGSDFS